MKLTDIPLKRVLLALEYDSGADLVRSMPSNIITRPLEIWLPAIGTWVRVDAHSYHGDQGRGYYYPKFLDRYWLRQATQAWMKQHYPPVR